MSRPSWIEGLGAIAIIVALGLATFAIGFSLGHAIGGRAGWKEHSVSASGSLGCRAADRPEAFNARDCRCGLGFGNDRWVGWECAR